MQPQLHFSDPRAFDDIYRSKFTKEPWFYDAAKRPESSFGFIDPQKSRERQNALRPLFSRRAVLKLENVIQQSVANHLKIITAT